MFQNLLRSVRRSLRPLRPKTTSVKEGEQFGWHNRKSCELLPGLPIGPKDKVIDVGCGDSETALFAAECGAEVYAVDIDPESISAVQKLARSEGLSHSLHTLVNDANPLPLPDNLATLVICQEVMEHVPDPRPFIAEFVRVGRPGACIC